MESICSPNQSVNLLDLPDETLFVVAEWVACFGLEDFSDLKQTCHKWNEMTSLPTLFEVIKGIYGVPAEELSSVTSIAQLKLYSAVLKMGLLEENRLGFRFATTNIDAEDGQDSGIRASLQRIEQVSKLLLNFPAMNIVIDAHCGIAAPHQVAPIFSLARGQEVQTQLSQAAAENAREAEVLHSRMRIQAWGRLVTNAAANSTHEFGQLARRGMGWVELHVRLGDNFELPRRHNLYQHLQPYGDRDDDSSDMSDY